MKIIKIIIAIILTIAVLYIARNNAMNQPKLYTHIENGYTFEYMSVPKGFENSTETIALKISGPLDETVIPVFRMSSFGNDDKSDMRKYRKRTLQLTDSTQNIYSTIVQTGIRGKKFYYFFELKDKTGGIRASLTMPDGKPFVFKYIGEVPPFVLLSHIILIFAAFFVISLVVTEAFSLIRGGTDVQAVAKLSFWAVVLVFLGGYPFGFAMNWYAFNCFWEGVPFGTDATDNKTQLWFVYLLFAMFSMLGSLRGKVEKNLYLPKTLGWISIGSFVNTVLIFLIPHSIQFSKEFTYSVCYGYIALFVLIYGVSLFKKKFAKEQI